MVRTLRIIADPQAANRVRVAGPKDAAAIFAERLGHEAVEVVGVLLLTAKWDVIGYHEACRGGVDLTPCGPREVLRAAMLANAAAIIVCHNHPSGDPTPSPDDQAVSRRLSAAAATLGIDVADFMIVGANPQPRYFSFREAGLMAGVAA